jgi:ribosomal subunit interface protein
MNAIFLEKKIKSNDSLFFLKLKNRLNMQVQAEIINHTSDTQLVLSIEQKVSKLKRFFGHINDIRITLSDNANEFRKERTAEIKIQVPNGVIFIKESSKTFDIALNKAMVSLRLHLLEHRAKQFSYCPLP